MDEAPSANQIICPSDCLSNDQSREMECLIIIICRRLSTNLEKNDAIRVCEYLLSGQEHRGAACYRRRLADVSCTHSSQVVSMLNTRASVSAI